MSKNKHPGFSLIETLVIVSLVSLLSLILVSIFSSFFRGVRKGDITKEARQNGEFALNIIERKIRSASLVSCTPSAITLQYVDSTQDIISCNDLGQGNQILLNNQNLTNEQLVEVDDCSAVFSCEEVYGSPSVVSIQFTLRQKGTAGVDDSVSLPFSTAVSLRNY